MIVYSLSYCKFLDLLLTTFRGFFVWGGGGRYCGTEKKEIYILYINIYVNCIVLLYRHWHCCLFIPSLSLLWVWKPWPHGPAS